MNRRHCVVGTLAVMTMLGVWTAGARGQATPAAATSGSAAPAAAAGAATGAAPVTIPQSAYANPGTSRAVIDDFVAKNVAVLLNDAEPALQGKARENLAQATMTAGASASAEFLFEYGRSLNNALSPKLNAANKPTLRQRLNIAIVAARVAEKAMNTTLQETTVKLINDPTEPVVLWGLKAAQPQVKEAVKAPGARQKLPPVASAIVPAVFKHPSGPVFDEAYGALDVNDPLVYLELMKLWGNRLSQYQGKEAPDDPAVDAKPVATLATADMWKTVLKDKDSQAKVMQMISDQLSVAAQWADLTTGDKHDQLVKVVKQCGEACTVIGIHQPGKEKLKAASEQLITLDPKSLAPARKLVPMAAPAIAEIPGLFPGVKPPPTVGAGLAAP